MARGRIPNSDIQAIRERAAIEEIIGEYVQLKPSGSDSLKGLSPFKDEKTPSFHVRPNHGYYHCFSTGKGGDVFHFLMEVEHLTFPEAVELVADKINYHINYQGGSTGAPAVEPGTRKRLIEANRAAHAFYRKQLETPQAQVARTFLLDRGFSKELIYSFECGYAPEGWDAVTKHLLKKFTFPELEAAGLSVMGRRGPIDRFRRRLLWPIKNISGDVIGFGARKLFDDDQLGKYLNTPETLLYKKSKVLFGLDRAKKNIASSRQCVVVEGYTDVMAMHAAGVTNVTVPPALATTRPHGARLALLKTSMSRGLGEQGAFGDTRGIVLELARLRAERAVLLGFPHHAALVAAESAARTTEAVSELLARLTAPAMDNARADAQVYAARMDLDPQTQAGETFGPADWPLYEAAERKERFGVDDEVLAPYLELWSVVTKGVFYAANRLYGITFHEREDLAEHMYAPGVKVWEVRDGEDAQAPVLGLFVGDYYARAGKSGGAWMDSLVTGSTLTGRQPVAHSSAMPLSMRTVPMCQTWSSAHEHTR